MEYFEINELYGGGSVIFGKNNDETTIIIRKDGKNIGGITIPVDYKNFVSIKDGVNEN